MLPQCVTTSTTNKNKNSPKAKTLKQGSNHLFLVPNLCVRYAIV